MPIQVVDYPTSFRSTQPWFVPPTTGAGLEMYYQANPTNYTLMAGGYVPSGTATASPAINPGVQFRVDVPCTLSAIRIYHVAADTSTFHWVNIWRSDDQSGQAWVSDLETNNEVTGWNPVYTWVSGTGITPYVPVELDPGVTYTITYWAQSGTTYASHTNGLTGSGSGILHTVGCASTPYGNQYPSTTCGMDGKGIDFTVTLDSPAGVIMPIDRATNSVKPLVIAASPTYVRGSMQVDQHLNVGQPAPTSSTPGLSITQPDQGNGYVGRYQFRLTADGYSQSYMIIENSMVGTYTPFGVVCLPSDSNGAWFLLSSTHDVTNTHWAGLREFGMVSGSTGSGVDPGISFNVGAYTLLGDGYPAWQIMGWTATNKGALVPGYDASSTQFYPDIGDGTTPLRPRDLWLYRNASVGGKIGVGLAVSASGYATIGSSSSVLTGTSQYGMSISALFSAAATTAATGLTISMASVGGSYTINTWTGLYITSPAIGSGASVYNNFYGIHIAAQDTATLSGYGLLIDAHTNQFSEGIRNNAFSHFMAAVDIGGSGSIYSGYGLHIGGTWVVPFNINAHSNDSTYFGIFEARGFFDSPWGGSSGSEVYARINTQAATFTMAAARCFWAAGPSLGAGSAITECDGLYVANMGGAGITNAYGVYIAAQSGASSTNIGLYNAGTTQLVGRVGIVAAPASNDMLYIAGGSTLSGGTQCSIELGTVFGSGATSAGRAVEAYVTTAAASFTMGQGAVFYADTPSLGAGSAITNQYGLYVTNQGGAGRTNAYGVYIAAQSGAATNNFGLYNLGTTRLDGNVGQGLNPAPNYGWYLMPTTSGSTGQVGMAVIGNFTTAATATGTTMYLAFQTFGSFSMGTGYALQIGVSAPQSGVTVSTLYGIRVENQGASTVQSAYGIYVAAQSGATSTNVGIYNVGAIQTGSISRIGDTGWTVPSFLNGYTAYSAPFNPGYRKFPDGQVQIRGLVTCPATAGTSAFQLPAGFRPATNMTYLFTQITSFGLIRVDVQQDGSVVCGTEVRVGTWTNGGWISLDGCIFLAEA